MQGQGSGGWRAAHRWGEGREGRRRGIALPRLLHRPRLPHRALVQTACAPGGGEGSRWGVVLKASNAYSVECCERGTPVRPESVLTRQPVRVPAASARPPSCAASGVLRVCSGWDTEQCGGCRTAAMQGVWHAGHAANNATWPQAGSAEPGELSGANSRPVGSGSGHSRRCRGAKTRAASGKAVCTRPVASRKEATIRAPSRPFGSSGRCWALACEGCPSDGLPVRGRLELTPAPPAWRPPAADPAT